MENRQYIAIDLKSFYASVECADLGIDPMTSNLVVADKSRTDKTICLAVTPALKSFGIPGRARLFEVIAKVREINAERLRKASGHRFTGKSSDYTELMANPGLELDFIVAPPHMSKYMSISTGIYDIYLKYVAHEDIHVYSIDEVFIDVTSYLKAYGISARELAMKMINDVYEQTGITATAGIGTNLYLCKIAMDIEAKHMKADKNGVRIAELNERTYREKLWDHRPLTDFWRVGKGISQKLEKYGMFTMGDVAKCSVGKPTDFHNEELLYKLFGINAELLIDHAWGWEPCTISEIKAYRPENSSISQGQVLQSPYSFDKAKLVMKEMTDMLVLDLVEKKLVADQMVLTVGYDIENLAGGNDYSGETTTDWYGRKVPKMAHSSINLDRKTSSARIITEAVMELFDRIVDRNLLVRRMYIVANHVLPESAAETENQYEQLNLFTDYEAEEKEKQKEEEMLAKEKKKQQAVLEIKRKFGKNSIVKGMNLEEGATGIQRNNQVGGHKA